MQYDNLSQVQCKATTFGNKFFGCIRQVVLYTMQVVLNVKEPFRTIGSGRNREVVALYKWPLVQVPLYAQLQDETVDSHYIVCGSLHVHHKPTFNNHFY